jgi:hypothetical protein
MKCCSFAVGIALSVFNVEMASAFYRLSPNSSIEERYRYESDHTSANEYHSDTTRGPASKQTGLPNIGRSIKPFTKAEQKWFDETPGYLYGNCEAQTSWPC